MALSFAPPQPARRRMAVSPLALPGAGLLVRDYRPEKDPFWDNIQSGGRSSKSGFARVALIVLEVGLTLRLGCGSHQCLTAKRSHSSIFWKNRPFDPTLGPSSELARCTSHPHSHHWSRRSGLQGLLRVVKMVAEAAARAFRAMAANIRRRLNVIILHQHPRDSEAWWRRSQGSLRPGTDDRLGR
jgi:hypothetical protein